LIDKCHSALLRKALLEKKDVTLTTALDIARAKETAERQASAVATCKVKDQFVNAENMPMLWRVLSLWSTRTSSEGYMLSCT